MASDASLIDDRRLHSAWANAPEHEPSQVLAHIRLPKIPALEHGFHDSSRRLYLTFWSGPYRSIRVALRYCPRRSHFVSGEPDDLGRIFGEGDVETEHAEEEATTGRATVALSICEKGSANAKDQ
jgi:hypothetical protein